MRQRRRQRCRARVSDLVSCEPRKPHCRSDPKTPTAQHPTARPHAAAHGASCRPPTDARAPTTGNPQRARVAVRPRSSVVRLGICGSAAASAVTPESPIWLSASRASHTASQTTKARCPASARTPKHTGRAAAHSPMREPHQQEPATRTRGRTAETERRERRHLRQRRRQRSDARVSDLVPCEPRNPHCCSDPKTPAFQYPTARPHAEAHGASCRPPTDARAPTTGPRNVTRGRTAEIEPREARHLRQRRRKRSDARVSDLVSCEPRKPHCCSDPQKPAAQTSDRAPAR
jgi:hypothetical protein